MRNTAKLFQLIFAAVILCCEHASASPKGVFYSDGTSVYTQSGGRNYRIDGAITPSRFYFFKDSVYLATAKNGIFKYFSDGWKQLDTAPFARRSVFSEITGCRRITALAEDPSNPSVIFAAAQHQICVSRDGGKSFREFTVPGFSPMNYITALEVARGGALLIGTAFNGLYEFSDGKIKHIGKGLSEQPDTSRKTFIESIAFIRCGEKKGEVFAGHFFGKGLFYSSDSGRTFRKIPLNINEYETVSGINFGKTITVAVSSGIIELTHDLSEIRRSSKKFPDTALFAADMNEKLHFDLSPYFIRKNRTEIKAIYSPARYAAKNTDKLIALIKKTSLNAVVIDFKDDSGRVYHRNPSKTAAEISSWTDFDFAPVLKKFKDGGIYTIARIVCFKDPKLYHAYSCKYAIKDSRTGAPWAGNSEERWVDPHSDFVRNYLIDCAEAASNQGFDEIQFDYIRFPADGAIMNCRYDFRTKDSFKSEILSDFLYQAKKTLTAKISVDIYGFNGYYHFGNSIGQDAESFAEYADAVSPMIYPSHYGSLFYRNISPGERERKIIFDSVIRSRINSAFKTDIRPYLQGFRLLSPTWGMSYITDQIQFSEKAGGAGFIFWNASCDYSVMEKALSK